MSVVILLTGPSSAGKTTLGRALQNCLPRPLIFLPGDERQFRDAQLIGLEAESVNSRRRSGDVRH